MMCICSSGILFIQSMDIVDTADKENEILKHKEMTVYKEVSANNHEFHHIMNVLKPNKHKPDHSFDTFIAY